MTKKSLYIVPNNFYSWSDYIQTMEEEEGKVIIRHESEMAPLRHRVLAKEGKQYMMTTLLSYENGDVEPVVGAATVSAETPLLEKYVRQARVASGINGMMVDYERYSYAYVNYEVSGILGLRHLMKSPRIFRMVQFNEDWVATKEGFYVETDVPYVKSDGTKVRGVYHLLKKQVVNGHTFYDDDGSIREANDPLLKKLRAKVFVYEDIAATSTPGQEKNGQVTLACTNLKGFDPVAHHNLMTCGAFANMVQEYSNEKLSSKQLAQAAARMSQYKAPARTTRPLTGICILMQKVSDETGNEYEDGLLRISAEMVADAFSDDDFAVLPQAIDGATIQCRPLWMTKGLGKVVPQKFLQMYLEEHKVKVEFIFQDELEDNDQAAFNDAVLRRKGKFAELTDDEKEDGYLSKAVAILPSRYPELGAVDESWLLEQIEVLEDLNAYKAPTDLRYPLTGLNILDMSHATRELEDEANASTQLLQTAMITDPKATKKFFVEKSRKAINSIMEEYLVEEGRNPMAGEFDGNLQLLASRIFPEFIRKQWAPTFQDQLNKQIEGWVHRLARLNMPVDGAYQKIIPDCSHEHGIDLLGYDAETGECEVFAPSLRGIDRAVGVKYPKCGVSEFGKFIPVTLEELVLRADEAKARGEINEDQYFMIVHELSQLHKGNIMVPCIESLKALLAGMDFDGDALIVFTDEELVNIFWNVLPEAVVISSDEEFFEMREAQTVTHAR